MKFALLASLAPLFAAVAAPVAGEGKILRPADLSALPSGEIDIIATAPAGKLLLDGRAFAAEQPFPDVLHAKVNAPGEHKLTLTWEGGAQEIRFFAGEHAPPAFTPFHFHPPVAGVDCTQCHELTRRGRFHFKGADACFACHRKVGFAKAHTHDVETLSECGLCHNPHGSTAKAHLLYPKETACKQCHN
jgi:predicted CXXCH cytochrome family protein